MKTLIHPAAAALFLLCAVCLPSCNKDNPNGPNRSNPTEFTLKGCDFDITVLDHERGYDRDSAYVFEGVWKDGAFRFGLEKLDPMTLNILPDGQNQLVLRVASDTPGFEGVNASSSARCINIVPDGSDHTVYHLEWVAEGESTITLWNGEGASRKEVSFKVTSRKEIPVEGIKMRIDGEIQMMYKMISFKENGELATDTYAIGFGGDYYFGNSFQHMYLGGKQCAILWYHKNPLDPSVHHTIEIIGPEPLNATTPELHILFDGFGIQDPWQKVTYAGEPFTDGYHYGDPNLWPPKKFYNLYDGNLENYPDFRWFTPFTLPEYWNGFEEKRDLPVTSVLTREIMPQLYLKDTKYSLLPSDLRERRVIMYDATGDFRGTMAPLVFSTQAKTYDNIDTRYDGYFFAFIMRDSRYTRNGTSKMLY